MLFCIWKNIFYCIHYKKDAKAASHKRGSFIFFLFCYQPFSAQSRLRPTALFQPRISFSLLSSSMEGVKILSHQLPVFSSSLLAHSTLLVSTLSCQCISNVPTAILLSRFTDNYKELLLGVNIGGTGTLIASLPSLITCTEYKMLYPDKTKGYLLLFGILNFIFLAVLLIAEFFIIGL